MLDIVWVYGIDDPCFWHLSSVMFHFQAEIDPLDPPGPMVKITLNS